MTGEVHTYSKIFRQETKTEKIPLGSGERYIKYEDMKKRLEDQKTHYLRSAEGSLIGKNEITWAIEWQERNLKENRNEQMVNGKQK